MTRTAWLLGLALTGAVGVVSGCGDDEPTGMGGSGGVAVGGGGSTGFEECSPGVLYPCYSGPPGTEGVGICASGMRECNAEGTDYGPCEGETLPQTETCETLEDDDCDGPANEDGAGCVCTPNLTSACYTGPAGTEGVGVCASGLQSCNNSGTMLSACVGEVLPEAEDCATPADESCEGLTPDGCSGDAAAAAIFGDTATQIFFDVETDSAGNFIVVGELQGQIDLGGGPLTSAGDSDIVVAKFSSTGAHVWSNRYGDADRQQAFAVDIAPDNSIWIAGVMRGTVDYGGGNISSAGGDDALVLHLDEDGGYLNAARYGDPSPDQALDIVAFAGGATVTGGFFGQIDLGGGPVLSGGDEDAFLLQVDTSGNPIRGMRFGNSMDQRGSAITMDSSNAVYVGLEVEGTVDVGLGTITSAGEHDVVLAKFVDAGWAPAFAEQYGDAADDLVSTLVVDGLGNVVMAGKFKGTIDLGAGTHVSGGGYDSYLAKVSPLGVTAWTKAAGGVGDDTGQAAALANGVVFWSGTFQDEANFGGGMAQADGRDLFMARYDAAGAHVGSHGYGGPGDQQSSGVAARADGSVIIVGVSDGSADFGFGPLPSNGIDGLILELAP